MPHCRDAEIAKYHRTSADHGGLTRLGGVSCAVVAVTIVAG